MDRKSLKNFATSAHAQLLAAVRHEIDAILIKKPVQIPASLKSHYEDFLVRTKPAVAESAEQLTYTIFNQLIFLRFIEAQGWLPELLPDASLDNFWQQPAATQQLLAQLQNVLPEIFTLPTLTREFLTLASPELFPIILNIMTEHFSYLDLAILQEVEALGWIYQYYNSAEKTRLVKLKKPYKKSAVPVVTQIFTPKFIVHYLVDNSLGKFLMENKFLPEDYELQFSAGTFPALQDEKTPTVEDLKQIKFLDPCCGSGHILIYAFELFYQAYKNLGVTPTTIPTIILQNNLYGLDVDDFAVQIARAVLIFTARLHGNNFFTQQKSEQIPNNNNLHILAIPESNTSGSAILNTIDDDEARMEALELFEFFDNAKELGSLLTPPQKTFTKLTKLTANDARVAEFFKPMLEVSQILKQTYHVVATNPPYINTNLMNSYLKKYVTKHFAKFHRDVFACFIKRAQDFTNADGYFALMTPNVWLTASSFTQLRENLLDDTKIITLLSLAPGTFFEEAVVDVVAFVVQNSVPDDTRTTFVKLCEKGDLKTAEHEFKRVRLDYFLLGRFAKSHNPIAKIFYLWPQRIFRKLPDSLMAFSAHEKLLRILENTTPLATYAEPRQGIVTGDNDRFLRFWFEVDPTTLAVAPKFLLPTNSDVNPTWFPHNKGGDYCKWYGNQAYVIDWADDGRAIKNHKSGDDKLSRIQNLDYNFRESVSWSAVTSGDFSARYYDETFTFNVAGPSCFAPPNLQKYLLGFLNSCVAAEFTKIINPTMNFNVGDIAKIPFIFDKTYQSEISQLVEQNITLAKKYYDSCELSWNFANHPLLLNGMPSNLLSESFAEWQEKCKDAAAQLYKNEERLSEIFINIYHLQNVLQPQVNQTKITIKIPDVKSAATSLLSYFVGYELGRYGHDAELNEIIFTSTNDVIERLKNFLTQHCGIENLSSNLRWLADSLKCPAATTAEEFLQEYFKNDFWRNHLAAYHGKPIYWQIDSGPTHAVRGFFYVHNFTPKSLLEKLLTHVTITQEKLLADLDNLETKKQQTVWPTERRRLENAQAKVVDKLRELNDFYQKLTTLTKQEIVINSGLGITKNYTKLSPILTELKPSRYMQKKRALLAKKSD